MEIIKPIEKKVIIDNGKKIIKDFWVKQGTDASIKSNIFLHHLELIKTIKGITEKSIFIQTDKELDYGFIETLNNLWARGVNIYLLTNKLYPSYKNTIVGKILIRYSNDIVGDLILIGNTTKISKGLISDNLNFCAEKKYFDLDNKQIEECFELFVYKFWKKADFECINEETFNSPIETQEPPFDIFPKINTESIISDDYLVDNIINNLEKYIKEARKKITIITNDLCIKNILINKVVNKNEKIKIEIITNIKKGLQQSVSLFREVKDCEIYAINSKLYPMIIVDNSIAIIFTGQISNERLINSFCIINKDINSLKKILDYKTGLILNKDTYHYRGYSMLENIKERSIISNIDNISLNTFPIIKMDKVEGEAEILNSLLDLYNEKSKREIVYDNKYSKIIWYSYYLMPKYRNEKLNRDNLYNNWKDNYLNIEKYSKEILKEITEITRKNSSLFTTVRRILNNKINFKEIEKDLRYVIDETQKKNYSMQKLKNFDSILKKSYSDYLKLNFNILQMKEYDEQMKIWKENKKNLEYNREQINNEVLSMQTKIDNINVSLSKNTSIELKQAIKNKEVEIEEIKQQMRNKSNLVEVYFKNNEILGEFNENIKKSKFKKPKDIKNIMKNLKKTVDNIFNDNDYFDKNYRNKFNNIKEQTVFKKIITDVILKDLNEFISKDLTELDIKELNQLNNLNEDLTKLKEVLINEKKEENFNNLKEKLLNLNKELIKKKLEKVNVDAELEEIGVDFQYKPSKNNHVILNVKKINIEMVREGLPKVGILYGNKNTRQLAIRYWEELSLGIEEAQRLNAELVCEI